MGPNYSKWDPIYKEGIVEHEGESIDSNGTLLNEEIKTKKVF